MKKKHVTLQKKLKVLEEEEIYYTEENVHENLEATSTDGTS